MAYKHASVQGTAGVTTYTTLYSTGADVTSLASRILATNTAPTAATIRVAVMGTAGTPTAADWLHYDLSVLGSDSLELPGVVIEPNKFVRVSSSANTITFSIDLAEGV